MDWLTIATSSIECRGYSLYMFVVVLECLLMTVVQLNDKTFGFHREVGHI